MAGGHLFVAIFCVSEANFYGYLLKHASFDVPDHFDFYRIYLKLDGFNLFLRKIIETFKKLSQVLLALRKTPQTNKKHIFSVPLVKDYSGSKLKN